METILTSEARGGDFAALTGRSFAPVAASPVFVAAKNTILPTNGLADEPIHGTTVIAVKYKDGVINVGDRRATGGMAIMYDKAEKVLPLDDFTLMAISGSFSKAMEITRYLRHSFRYYERSQLQPMSLDGKLSELGKVISGNQMAAMQGIGLVIPILSTFDAEAQEGRIFFYDGGGARFETAEFGAAGSGSTQIRGVFEYIQRTQGAFREMERDEALKQALLLLEIAADLDAATGGAGKVLPLAKTITKDGIADVEEDVLRGMVRELVGRDPLLVGAKGY
ncbi:MAG: proteasome subunit alpha [Armatimonadetes bacterium]|nr:proteasome subunit alpha [Armatimonadota bacterium]